VTLEAREEDEDENKFDEESRGHEDEADFLLLKIKKEGLFF
jgi:hypothetical protein